MRPTGPLRVNVNAIRLLVGLKMLRNKHVLPPWCTPRLPVFVHEPEDRAVRENRSRVDSHRVFEIVLHKAEHLVGLANLDRMWIEPVVASQVLHDTAMDAGDK